jgi:flap endonuclease-1
MGIKNLTQLIKCHSPDSIQTKSLYELRGKKAAIDSSIIIYKSLTNYRNNGEYIRNDKNNIISHLLGILNKTILYLSLGIMPVYIFDGKPPDAKQDTLDERKNRVNESVELLKNETNKEEQIKLEKKTIRITKQYINEIKELLDILTIQYYHPDGEAETFASELCRIGEVDYVVTEDMDALACGSPFMVRNCIDRTIKRNDVVSIFDLEKVLSDFNMNFTEFIDLCILCGCDYCPTIQSIGPKTAFKLIQKHKTIENILLHENKLTITDSFKNKYKIARDSFYIFKDKITVQKYDRTGINQTQLSYYLKNELNLPEKRVQNYIKKINLNNNDR